MNAYRDNVYLVSCMQDEKDHLQALEARDDSFKKIFEKHRNGSVEKEMKKRRIVSKKINSDK